VSGGGLSGYELIAILITLSAILAFINERWLKLGTAIGGTVGGLLTSLVLTLMARLGLADLGALAALRSIDFNRVVMQGLLSFLLFAGAFDQDARRLARYGGRILTLSTVGVVLSTLLVAGGLFGVSQLLGLHLPFSYALLFGALISPTDPVAVLSILGRTSAPEDVTATIAGESLFNDGVGVVVFTVILGIVAVRAGAGAGGAAGAVGMVGAAAAAAGGAAGGVSIGHVARLFLEEAGGGVVFGVILGFVAEELLRRIDNFKVEILITLAVVTGGYGLAQRMHASGPLAMVLAGLMIGSRGRRIAMSELTQRYLSGFWSVIDDILNMVLFMLIGIEFLVLDLSPGYIVVAVVAIPVALAARYVSVWLPMALIRLKATVPRGTVRVMTWGGLRGGIAIALALSLPASDAHDLLVFVTYAVVIFSIIVQGLSMERLVKRVYGEREAGEVKGI
jgi:Na+:H+ antiporter